MPVRKHYTAVMLVYTPNLYFLDRNTIEFRHELILHLEKLYDADKKKNKFSFHGSLSIISFVIKLFLSLAST